MKRFLIITIFLTTVFAVQSLAQAAVISVLGVDPEHVCSPGNVYVGTTKAPVSRESIPEIEKKLNEQVTFAKKFPSLSSQPIVEHAVNCFGKFGGGIYMARSSGDIELDKELMDFFSSLNDWVPGEEEGKPVDCWFTWRFIIKNGYIKIVEWTH